MRTEQQHRRQMGERLTDLIAQRDAISALQNEVIGRQQPAGEAKRVEQDASPKPAVPSRSARGAGKAKRPAAAPPPVPAAPGDSGCVTACIRALEEGPLTSVEVIKRSKYSEGGVYTALAQLRKAGRIEMIDDDGVRKNRLVAE